MANNQITPFQLTDQFTMDNFNQRINETNIALQKKAPAGYGLGASSKNVTDWNNEKTNGWVRDSGGTEDKHSPFVGLFSVGLISDYASGGDTFQLAFARNQYEKVRTYIKFRAYNGDNKVWGEWEWVNPPMALGEEYRTTERYMSKPVYAKAINFGELPNNSAKAVAHGISNMDICFMVYGHDTANQRPIPTLCLSGSFDTQIGITATSSDVVIHTNYNPGGDSAIVVMKYTKTTD